MLRSVQKVTLIILIQLFISLPVTAGEQPLSSTLKPELKVSIAELPSLAEKNGTGALVNLIRALDRKLGTQSTVVIAPFARSISSLQSGEVDLHLPIVNLQSSDKPQYYLSQNTILYTVHVVLYTHKGSQITRANIAELAAKKKIHVITDHMHTKLFDFPVKGTSCMPCAIRMLDKGRIDAVIYGMVEGEKVITEYQLQNISHELYQSLPAHVAFPSEARALELEKPLAQAIKELRSTGEYQSLMRDLLVPYRHYLPD